MLATTMVVAEARSRVRFGADKEDSEIRVCDLSDRAESKFDDESTLRLVWMVDEQYSR